MKARRAVPGLLATALTLAAVALALAIPAGANPPAYETWSISFEDLNPCTGDMHEVTVSGTTLVHEHDGRVVAQSTRTITTSPTGFVGSGTDTYVLNGQVETYRLSDVLRSSSGDRMRVRYSIVVDVSTGITRAESFAFTCLGKA